MYGLFSTIRLANTVPILGKDCKASAEHVLIFILGSGVAQTVLVLLFVLVTTTGGVLLIL